MAPLAPAFPRRSSAADLVRLAIPIVLVASAVAVTLWIDRGSPFDPTVDSTPASGPAAR